MLARLGRAEGEEHIRLDPAVLRFLSPLAGAPAWEEGFALMLAKAAGAGWIDQAGAVRAHVVPTAQARRIDANTFRATFRNLAAGVSAITTGSLEDPVGMVASSVVSISADPPLVGVLVNQTASALPYLRQQERFAVSVLGQEHDELMREMAQEPQGKARFRSADWQEAESGLPILPAALAVAECRLIAESALGTHLLLVGLIERSQQRPGLPLVYFDGGILPVTLNA
ncbi:MAG: flavin reductase family protein [Pararhodobacter sp.]|nr:flavin reductase family protein [Pararhodobacter sp.]